MYYRHIWSKSCWAWLPSLLPSFSPSLTVILLLPNLQHYNRRFVFFNPLFASALLLFSVTTSWCIFLGLKSPVYIWERLVFKRRLKLSKYFICFLYMHCLTRCKPVLHKWRDTIVPEWPWPSYFSISKFIFLSHT